MWLTCFGFKYENVWAKIGETKIWESKKPKLLGVEIDRTFSLDEYNRWLLPYVGKLEKNIYFNEIIKFCLYKWRKSFDENIDQITV